MNPGDLVKWKYTNHKNHRLNSHEVGIVVENECMNETNGIWILWDENKPITWSPLILLETIEDEDETVGV